MKLIPGKLYVVVCPKMTTGDHAAVVAGDLKTSKVLASFRCLSERQNMLRGFVASGGSSLMFVPEGQVVLYLRSEPYSSKHVLLGSRPTAGPDLVQGVHHFLLPTGTVGLRFHAGRFNHLEEVL